MGTTSLHEINGHNVNLFCGELLRRENDNRSYLMELTNRNLLYNYELEAAITLTLIFLMIFMAAGNLLHASLGDIS